MFCDTIKIKHRKIYGMDVMDICDTHQQEAIRDLTGCKTVTHRHIDSLRRLGFVIIDLDQVLAEMFN